MPWTLRNIDTYKKRQASGSRGATLYREIEWIIHSIYGVKKFHSLREFHSIFTPVEWKFTTQRVESRPVHSICTPKEIITDVTTQEVTDVTTQWVTSVTNRVKIHSIFFLESIQFPRKSANRQHPRLEVRTKAKKNYSKSWQRSTNLNIVCNLLTNNRKTILQNAFGHKIYVIVKLNDPRSF